MKIGNKIIITESTTWVYPVGQIGTICKLSNTKQTKGFYAKFDFSDTTRYFNVENLYNKDGKYKFLREVNLEKLLEIL